MWSNLLRVTQPDGWGNEEEEDYSESETFPQEENNDDMIPPSARIAAGVNRLSGRFTQFLAEVTQPADDEYDEEEYKDGWAENDDDLDQVLDEVEDEQQQNQWEHPGIPDLHDELPDVHTQPIAQAAQGWNNNEDEFDFSSPSREDNTEELLGEVNLQESIDVHEGWNDNQDDSFTLSASQMVLQTEPLATGPEEEPQLFYENESPQEPELNASVNNNGWDEDEFALDLSGPNDPTAREDDNDEPPFQPAANPASMVVDHVPLTGEHSIQASDVSLVVLAAADDRTRDTGPVGDPQDRLIEEEQDVYDDEDEIRFAPVVDHLPRSYATPRTRGDSLAVQGNDGDGTIGETSGWADDEDDLSVLIDEPQEEQGPTVVDHTPYEIKPQPSADASVDVLASEMDSMVAQDEFVDSDPQNDRHAFGLIVDLTPVASSRKESLSSVDDLPPAPFTGSLAVNAEALEQDIQEDEEMDDTLNGDSIIAGGTSTGWDDDDILPDDDDDEEESVEPMMSLEAKRPEKKTATFSSQLTTVVDHTPSELPEDGTATILDPSVKVLAAEEDLTRDTGDGDDEEVYDDENEMNFGKVVDVTPHTPSRPIAYSGDFSMDVHASALKRDFEEDDKMDESYYGDSTIGERAASGVLSPSGWDDDNILEEDEEGHKECVKDDTEERKISHKKITTFSSELTMHSHLVDHTPSEMPVENDSELDPSVAALAAGIDVTQNTEISVEEEVYDDENEMNYGPVVDVLPQTPRPSVSDSGANSLAVRFKKDFEDDSCYDSTVGGASGWDQEDPIPEDQDSGHDGEEPSSTVAGDDIEIVVDHTPSEMAPDPSLVRDPSIDVTGSEGLTKEDGDVDSTGEKVVYGKLVDHTPLTPAPLNIRSDSVMVQLDEEDGATLEGEDTIIENSTVCDETTVDEEMPGPLRSEEDPQLVDYVPPRSESRFGDASTGVAADPSEILSEVDDTTQEGVAHFGPVVDVTPIQPLPGMPEHPSGAASTIVFAPSMLADDLDDADDTGDADDSWGQDDAEILAEAAPNPQSGNDEPVEQTEAEQLVDYIPAPDSVVAQIPRDAASELTIGAQSQLQVDPNENDFLPIVDLTPTLASPGLSHASIATQVTASECRAMSKEDASQAPSETPLVAKVVVDQLPDQKELLKLDSVGTVARSQLSEDDEEDDSKYGLVVDHLPLSGVSSSPSRGGSTVDALATVSENGSCDDGEGWEDEIDFDGSEGCMSDRAAFVSNVLLRGALRSSSQSQASSVDQERMSVRFDASVTNDTYSTPAVDEEPSAIMNPVGDHDAISKSFADADTPPSTPYRKGGIGLTLPQSPSPILPSITVRDATVSSLLDSAPTTDVRDTLHSQDPESMLHSESEILRLQHRVAELESTCSHLTDQNHALHTAMETANKQNGSEVSALEDQLKAKEAECHKILQDQLYGLQQENARASAMLEEIKAESDRRKQSWEAESKALRDARDDLSSQLIGLQKHHEQELQRQNDIIDQQTADVRAFESANTASENERFALLEQIAELKQFEEKSELLAKELISVAEERDRLQETLTSSNAALTSLQNLVDANGENFNSVQSKIKEELESFKNEVQFLKETLVNKDKEILDLQNTSHAASLESAELNTRLMQLEMDKKLLQTEIESLLVTATNEKFKSTNLESQLELLKQDLQQVSDEKDSIQKQKDTTTHHLAELGKTLKKMDLAKKEQQNLLHEVQAQLEESRNTLSAVSRERDALRSDLDQHSKRVLDSDAVLRECQDRLAQAIRERDALTEENEELLVQFALIKEQLDQTEEQCFALQSEIESIRGSHLNISVDDEKSEGIETLHRELQAASLSFTELVREKESLMFQLECATKDNESLSEQLAVLESNAGNDEKMRLENMQLMGRIEDLQAQCEQTTEARNHLEGETRLLQERLRNTVAQDSNTGDLDHRLVELEALLMEKDRKLASKNQELLAAKKKLVGMVESTKHQQLLSELSQKRQALNQATSRVTEWEQKYEMIERELERVCGNLTAAQSTPDLTQQVESLQRSLHATNSRLAAKEAEVDRLNKEIAQLESLSKDKSIAETLNDATESTSDDVKTLRHQIVSLAVALERSENKRAEAIDRLQSEREMNSESLRRLSESMKRFYSTVSVKDV